MSSQFIRATEAFCAARELATVGLLPGVGSYMSCLMFETVEGLIAEGAFVWAR